LGFSFQPARIKVHGCDKRENHVTKSVAIVTGASSGIGKATALRLSRDFSAVVLVARSGEKLAEVGAEVSRIGAEAAAARKIAVEDAKQQFLRQAGITRFGEPEEIAGLMAFAVSPAARWLTGTVLRMDGGEVKSV
jgi:3-oxoacyl-[acyl-carrier protein] reductase